MNKVFEFKNRVTNEDYVIQAKDMDEAAKYLIEELTGEEFQELIDHYIARELTEEEIDNGRVMMKDPDEEERFEMTYREVMSDNWTSPELISTTDSALID